MDRSRSLIDKFIKCTLVTVLIRRFCTKVIITNEFPKIEMMNIIEYNGIRISPLVSKGTDLFLNILVMFEKFEKFDIVI